MVFRGEKEIKGNLLNPTRAGIVGREGRCGGAGEVAATDIAAATAGAAGHPAAASAAANRDTGGGDRAGG